MDAKELEALIAYRYPEQDLGKIRELLGPLIAEDDSVYLVIDDDPTGGQTVHDIDVYTEWSQDTLNRALAEERRMFYVMTNSRSFTEEETKRVHREITERALKAAALSGKRLTFISRGDSTLRGHYPTEVDMILRADPCPGKQLLIPYFLEGNRFTVQDIHYLRSDGRYIPVGESEFSRDKTFGYKSSDLKAWAEEKTSGGIRQADVASISLDMLRGLRFDEMEQVLCGGSPCVVVNAACDDDLRSFAVAYLRACRKGIRFVARTASSWPRVIGNVSDAGLLPGESLTDPQSGTGGLIVVGSHVNLTTRQLERLTEGLPDIRRIELNQHLVFQDELMQSETARTAAAVSQALASGYDCVLYTRRERLDIRGSEEEELKATQKIAAMIVETVNQISVQPRFMIAKGGITSSDIATKALKITHAVILGQIEPGIPVWLPASGTRYRNMPFIIFPGNVGSAETLLHLVKKLR